MSANQPHFIWRKSSYSGEQANCVEIGHGRQAVGIRDTKDPAGGTLLLTTAAFHALLTTAR